MGLMISNESGVEDSVDVLLLERLALRAGGESSGVSREEYMDPDPGLLVAFESVNESFRKTSLTFEEELLLVSTRRASGEA